jgi:hypothetical protein
MEVNDHLHAPAALATGASPLYPLDRMLSRPRNQSERCEEQNKLLSYKELNAISLVFIPQPNRYFD